MKIGGKELISVNKTSVTLKRGQDVFRLIISALPPGWQDQMEARGLTKWPKPPKELKTLPGSKRPMKDPATGSLIFEENREDPEFKEAFRKQLNRYYALKLREALRMDTSVEFLTSPPGTEDAEDWARYADALVAELFNQQSGFNLEETLKLIDVADTLQAELNIDEATADF